MAKQHVGMIMKEVIAKQNTHCYRQKRFSPFSPQKSLSCWCYTKNIIFATVLNFTWLEIRYFKVVVPFTIMCGIWALFGCERSDAYRACADRVSHRGPDCTRFETFEKIRGTLAFHRLRVVGQDSSGMQVGGTKNRGWFDRGCSVKVKTKLDKH